MVDTTPSSSRTRRNHSTWSASLLLSTGLLLMCGVSGVDAMSKDEWRTRSIYQVVTDRFALTNGSLPECPPLGRYCGGSWTGIVNKLDYIQGMGFDSVWISPVAKQVDANGAVGQAYHGYWPGDLTGTAMTDSDENLTALSNALHKRGMALMVDVVMNHVAFVANDDKNAVFDPTIGRSSASATDGVYGALNKPEYFHPPAKINYGSEKSVQEGWLSYPGAVQLADIKTTDSTVRTLLYDNVKRLVKKFNIDGLRLDAARHVEKDFWKQLKDVGVYTVAEVFHGDANYVKPFQTDAFDGALGFPLYYVITRGFGSTSGSMAELAFMIGEMSYYTDPTTMAGMVSNHDLPRAASITKDSALLRNMHLFNYIGDAIPIWYYGDEHVADGVSDPKNREALWLLGDSPYNTKAELYQYANKLNAIRRAAGAFSSSFYTTKNAVVQKTDHDIVLSKYPLLSVLTNRGSAQSGTSKMTVKTSYDVGTVVIDALSCKKKTVDAKKQISVTVSGGQPQVFLPLSAVTSSSGFCSDAVGPQRMRI